MNPFARLTRTLGLAALFGAGVVVASCSGGIVQPATPTTASTSVPVTAGSTVQLAKTANGQVASLGFAAGAPSGVTLSATSSTTAPVSAPVPSSISRRTAQDISGAVPFYWVTFTVSASLSAQYLASESVSLTSSDPTSASYFAEFDDITSAPATKLGSFGPATSVSGVATIENDILSGTTAVPTLQTGHTYLLQFYYIPASALPSPSPSPSATPLPTFTFSGNSDTDSPTSCNTTSCLQLYLSPGTIIQFPAASAATTLVATLASGANQISPSGTFPYLTGQGTVIQYVQVSASPAVTFATTPSIMVNGGLGSETSCSFYGYLNNNNAYAWTLIAGPATVSGSSVSIPSGPAPGGGTVDLSPTPFYGAIVCSP